MNNFKVGDVLRNTDHDKFKDHKAWRRVKLLQEGVLILESTMDEDFGKDSRIGKVISSLTIHDYNTSSRWKLDESYNVETLLKKYEM